VSAAHRTSGHETIAFVHILRGCAALLVVWAHVSGYWLYLTGQSSTAQELWDRWIVVPFHVHQDGGYFAVLLFFLISGYIVSHTSLRESRTTYAVKRLLRIFPALGVAILVVYGLVHLMLALGQQLPGFADGPWWWWLSAPFLLDGSTGRGLVLSVTWTLVIEVVFYAMVLVVLRLQREHPLRSTWILVALWAGLYLLFWNVPVLQPNAAAGIYVGFLLLGRVVYQVQRELVSLRDGVLLSAVILVLFWMAVTVGDHGYLLAPGGWTGQEPIVSQVAAILVFLGFLRWAPRRAVQPFGFLGDVSYSLYLLHLPIGFAVLVGLTGLGVGASVGAVVAIAASLAAAWVSYAVVERPVARLARVLLRRLPGGRGAPLGDEARRAVRDGRTPIP